MDGLFLLSEAQMHRIEPFFILSHAIPVTIDAQTSSCQQSALLQLLYSGCDQ